MDTNEMDTNEMDTNETDTNEINETNETNDTMERMLIDIIYLSYQTNIDSSNDFLYNDYLYGENDVFYAEGNTYPEGRNASYNNTSYNNVSYNYGDANSYEGNNSYEGTNSYEGNNTEIMNHSFLMDKKKYNTVLADDEVLKTTLYQKKEGEEEEKCPIMTTPFLPNQEIITLPCNHFFEPIAIKKWLQEEKAECPVCRYNAFETKEIKVASEAAGATAAQGAQSEAAAAEGAGTIDTIELNRLVELFIRYQDYSEYNTFIQTVRSRND